MRRTGLITALAALAAIVVVSAVVLAKPGSDEPDPGPAPSGQSLVAGGDSRKSERTDQGAPETDAQLLAGAEGDARAFLDSYLPLIYGRKGARPSDLEQASPSLVRQLEQDAGRVPPGQKALTPKVERVSIAIDSRKPLTAQATARIRDSKTGSPYPLIFYLEQQQGDRWVVARLR